MNQGGIGGKKGIRIGEKENKLGDDCPNLGEGWQGPVLELKLRDKGTRKHPRDDRAGGLRFGSTLSLGDGRGATSRIFWLPRHLGLPEPTCWPPSTQPHQVARLLGPSNLLGRNVELHLIKSIYTETRLIKSLLPRSPLFVFT